MVWVQRQGGAGLAGVHYVAVLPPRRTQGPASLQWWIAARNSLRLGMDVGDLGSHLAASCSASRSVAARDRFSRVSQSCMVMITPPTGADCQLETRVSNPGPSPFSAFIARTLSGVLETLWQLVQRCSHRSSRRHCQRRGRRWIRIRERVFWQRIGVWKTKEEATRVPRSRLAHARRGRHVGRTCQAHPECSYENKPENHRRRKPRQGNRETRLGLGLCHERQVISAPLRLEVGSPGQRWRGG